VEQIYVNKVKNLSAVPDGMEVKSKGGITISGKKRGGWQESWKLSQRLAGWIA